jgi:hypothetical protein
MIREAYHKNILRGVIVQDFRYQSSNEGLSGS